MAFEYYGPDRDQLFLLPPSITEWLPESHLVWFVLDVVSIVDTSAFHARHPNDGVGRPAYDPEMMLGLLIYAYCTGLRSSRRIEAACRTDLAFRAITVQLVPSHFAIARFRVDHETAIRDVFVDVLRLCAQTGLADLGTIAIDGTKIATDAALDANRGGGAIRAEVDRIMTEASKADSDLVQPTLGGDLPDDLARRGSRRARLEAALVEIETQQRAADERSSVDPESEAAEGRKVRGRKPKGVHAVARRAAADLEALKVKALSTKYANARRKAEQKIVAAQQRADETRVAAAATPPPELKANTTDPQSRTMKTAAGWLQGFNAQAAVNAGQIVIAAAVTQDHNDSQQLTPMMNAVQANATAAGITGQIGIVLADAGYWSDANATADGPDRLIATTKDWKQRRQARELGLTEGPPPPGATQLDAMEHRLRTLEGTTAYKLRSHTVEPVFGQIKENRGMRRFMRRGLAAAQSEWSLMCATNNIKKLFTHTNRTIFTITTT
jgi:transposase